MLCKSFRFGRLSSSQFNSRMEELNAFLKEVNVIGLPQVTANDEEGTIMFAFYTEKSQEPLEQPKLKNKKLGESNE